ncbi:MAG: hypothetical protein JNL62_17575 [Bryobacterales bacterium]|nr:hypothetical protein [Bryobacterales bacterium]
MIRHAGLCGPLPLPIGALPVAMIELAFSTALVAFIGASFLAKARLLAALRAAIAMASIAMRADEKDRMALFPATGSLQEYSLTMHRRRHCVCPAGIDNGSLVMSG